MLRGTWWLTTALTTSIPFSQYINYWGTSPSERDHGVIIRKMPLGAENRPIYQEHELDKLPAK